LDRDRDYVDRFVVLDPSYDMSRNNDPMNDWRIFDPDHMNPIGARRFTTEVLKRFPLRNAISAGL
jgi:hypothetical protein